MSELITIHGASKRFPNGNDVITALRNVDFTLNAGELVAVTGRSGSGKSTLLKVCAGIEVVDEGCLLYTSPSPRDGLLSRMPSSA